MNDGTSYVCNLKPEAYIVTCSQCGTKFTIMLNTPGCFYCPKCNSADYINDHSKGGIDYA